MQLSSSAECYTSCDLLDADLPIFARQSLHGSEDVVVQGAKLTIACQMPAKRRRSKVKSFASSLACFSWPLGFKEVPPSSSSASLGFSSSFSLSLPCGRQAAKRSTPGSMQSFLTFALSLPGRPNACEAETEQGQKLRIELGMLVLATWLQRGASSFRVCLLWLLHGTPAGR